MKHPSLKFVQLQYVMLGVTILIGIFSLVKDGWSFLNLFMFYTLASSFLFEGLAQQSQQNMTVFIEQVIRAALIIVFSTILYF